MPADLEAGMHRRRSREDRPPDGSTATDIGRRQFIGNGARLLAGVVGTRSAVTASRRADGLRLTTLAGDSVPVDRAALADLERTLRGDVIVDGMAGYDSARR